MSETVSEEQIREGLVFYNILVGTKYLMHVDKKTKLARYGMSKDEAELTAERVRNCLQGEGLGSEYEVMVTEA